MAWLDSFTQLARDASSAISSVATTYVNLQTARNNVALQRAEMEARLAEARANLAAGQGSGAGGGAGSGGGISPLMIGALLLGGLVLWKVSHHE